MTDLSAVTHTFDATAASAAYRSALEVIGAGRDWRIEVGHHRGAACTPPPGAWAEPTTDRAGAHR